MQKPFAYSPVHRIVQNFILTRTQISIIAFAGAILLFMIGCALLNARYGSSAAPFFVPEQHVHGPYMAVLRMYMRVGPRSRLSK